MADDLGRSTHTAIGYRNSNWKKNLDIEKHSSTENSRTASLLSHPPADNNNIIVPVPTGTGMNHNYFKQQQHASNGASNQSTNGITTTGTAAHQASVTNLNLNNVFSVQNSNQNATSHSNGQQGSNAAWLQHMILNPIHPLHSAPSSVSTSNSGGNGGATISNQANNFARQQQLQANIQGNTSHNAYRQQQASNQVSNSSLGASSIAKTLTVQQQTLMQPVRAAQPQQQQNLRQLLPLNELASQLQVPGARQSQTLQQQQAAAPSTNNQVPVLPNTAETSAQQQQQLLLLALMLQQQNSANTNGSGVDASALSTALATPEGLRLINSLLVGQQLQSIQGNRVQQQQQPSQVSQGPTPASSGLSVDLLSPTLAPAIQDDGLNHHQFFLSQQQTQAPKPAQPQGIGQPLQLPTLTFLNSNLQALTPNIGESPIGNTGISFPPDAITGLAMKNDEVAKAGDGKGIGFPATDKNSKDANAPPANSRFPRLLYCESDDAILGEYQTLLRQQLELFEADSHDVINGTFRQGRTTPIRLGQIGLRCKHCAKAPMSARTKGSIYCKFNLCLISIEQTYAHMQCCKRSIYDQIQGYVFILWLYSFFSHWFTFLVIFYCDYEYFTGFQINCDHSVSMISSYLQFRKLSRGCTKLGKTCPRFICVNAARDSRQISKNAWSPCEGRFMFEHISLFSCLHLCHHYKHTDNHNARAHLTLPIPFSRAFPRLLQPPLNILIFPSAAVIGHPVDEPIGSVTCGKWEFTKMGRSFGLTRQVKGASLETESRRVTPTKSETSRVIVA